MHQNIVDVHIYRIGMVFLFSCSLTVMKVSPMIINHWINLAHRAFQCHFLFAYDDLIVIGIRFQHWEGITFNPGISSEEIDILWVLMSSEVRYLPFLSRSINWSTLETSTKNATKKNFCHSIGVSDRKVNKWSYTHLRSCVGLTIHINHFHLVLRAQSCSHKLW